MPLALRWLPGHQVYDKHTVAHKSTGKFGKDEIVQAMINYVAQTPTRMRYFANDSTRDTVVLAPHAMTITESRDQDMQLDRNGFQLVGHRSAVTDFADVDEVNRVHSDEITALLSDVTGADAIIVTGTGVRRFAERSSLSGALDNSRPARFAHVDVSDRTAAEFALRSQPRHEKNPRRTAHYNVWRALSTPPQDVPLALCDARSVGPDDLIAADAVFDRDGVDVWSFEGLVVTHSADHRWHWFRDLTRDEAIIFKTNDSDPSRAHCVPHVAFDDPDCPPGVPPRASIEMRAIAYWF